MQKNKKQKELKNCKRKIIKQMQSQFVALTEQQDFSKQKNKSFKIGKALSAVMPP